jgi:hypothetical protein
MRYSSWLAIVIMGLCLCSAFEYHHYYKQVSDTEHQVKLRREFQKAVGLPNLAITSAARYLRHYSITDIATPFQDYPASLDHFPAGFAFAPPEYSNMPGLIDFCETKKNSGDK